MTDYWYLAPKPKSSKVRSLRSKSAMDNLWLYVAKDLYFLCRQLGIDTKGIWPDRADPHMRKHHLAEGVLELERRLGPLSQRSELAKHVTAYREDPMIFMITLIREYPGRSLLSIARAYV